MRLSIVLLAGILGILSCRAAELVKDGKACSEIVVSEKADPATLQAAKDLQLHLKKISGAEVKIVTPGKAQLKNLICVEESSVTKKAGYKMPVFKTSGYDIQSKGKLVILTGATAKFKPVRSIYAGALHEQSRLFSGASETDENDCGPMHAVSAFLEYLGVRFYAPYEDGTVIPRKKSVKIPDFRETREAAFARRIYQYEGMEKDPEGMMWFKRLKTGSSLPPAGVLPLAAVLKNDPPQDWIALRKNGEPQFTIEGCIYPRFAHPGFQRECVKFIRKALDADPSMEYLELVLPVLRGGSDTRDYKAFNTRDRYPLPVDSNIMAAFYNTVAAEVKKSHPGRILRCPSFRGNQPPTEQFLKAVPDNLKMQPYSQGSVLYAIGGGKKYLDQLARLETAYGNRKMQQVEWWNEFSCSGTPRQGAWFMHSLQEVRKEQRKSVAGLVMKAAAIPGQNRLAEVPLTHLMYYVNSKLLWDPELDMEKLLDEYCRLWFGPAADVMRNFFRFSEHVVSRNAPRSISAFGQFREEDIPFLFELLGKAKAKTVAGTVYRRRVEALETVLSPLKNAFRNRTEGTPIHGQILTNEAKCNGDFSKYSAWQVIPGSAKGVRTEFALGMTEDRSKLFAAVKCFEPQMAKLKPGTAKIDSPAVFAGDHIRIDFNTMNKAAYLAAVNAAGGFADASSDPEDLAENGSYFGWNNPLTGHWVKRYPDRWEAEIAVHVQKCGTPPDFGEPWGLKLTRVRYAGGKKEVIPLITGKQGMKPFVIPKTYADGTPATPHYNILRKLPGIPDETVYTVKRATGPVDLSAPWDGKCWKNIPELRLGWELVYPRSRDFHPDARAKFQYDDQYLYVLYQVKDRYIRANFKNDQGMVCLDSCMEFFIQPDQKGPYYNFECNCIGTLLLYEVMRQEGRLKMAPLSLEELKEVKRFSTLPRNLSGETNGPLTWRLGLQIPLSLFVRRAGVNPALSGQVWYGNVYKCADWTSNPCWLMWKKNDGFHNPEGFGAFIFE